MQFDIPDEIFDIGILNREYHDRLLMNLKQHASSAGIPPRFVWSKLSQYCTDKDMEWVSKLRSGSDSGMIYEGTDFKVPVEDKMMAITGACLRNYLDARMMTVQEVLDRIKGGDMPASTLILVPNFCMASTDVASVAPWQSAALLGWLYSRLAKNLKTVLYVGSMTTLSATYGEAMESHLRNHYSII